MRQALGITPAIWDQMRLPKAMSGGELGMNTQLYVDVYIAVECLHMRYPEYIQRTTSDERTLYQLYYSLKSLKEEHAREVAEAEAKMQRDLDHMHGAGYRH